MFYVIINQINICMMHFPAQNILLSSPKQVLNTEIKNLFVKITLTDLQCGLTWKVFLQQRVYSAVSSSQALHPFLEVLRCTDSAFVGRVAPGGKNQLSVIT